MKDAIELEGTTYHLARAVAKKFKVDSKTVLNWSRSGILQAPIKIGRHSYYDLRVCERRILASAHL